MKLFESMLQHMGMRKPKENVSQDPRWTAVKDKLSQAKNIIDLGCGNNPVAGAAVGVDLYLDPKERHGGHGPTIDIRQMESKGIKFINSRVDALLPFQDKEFDFAYSHHVFEHLDDPVIACQEMMRIAKAGVIITPAYFAEIIFGRSYHRWLVMERENTIYFLRKRPFENIPFGTQPIGSKDGKTWRMDENTNPFDMLLNDEEWYGGQEGQMPKLTKILRQHWYSHSPLLEIVFLWDDKFECKIIE